jgi:hypothetical protein
MATRFSKTSRRRRGIRTGYEEKDLMNYGVYSLKINGALHYRISKGTSKLFISTITAAVLPAIQAAAVST